MLIPPPPDHLAPDTPTCTVHTLKPSMEQPGHPHQPLAAAEAAVAAAAAPAAAAAAGDSTGTPRQQLADEGQAQVLQLLRTGQQLLQSYGELQLQQGAPPGLPAAQQQLAALQQQYLAAAQQLAATLQRCDQLQQRELQQQQQQVVVGEGTDGASAVAALEATAAGLEQQLAARNAAIKGLIDKLRQLMDAFSMWESHRRHLVQHAVQYAAAGSGSIA